MLYYIVLVIFLLLDYYAQSPFIAGNSASGKIDQWLMTVILFIVLVTPESHHHHYALWKETTGSCLTFITRLNEKGHTACSLHQKTFFTFWKCPPLCPKDMAVNIHSLCCSLLQPAHSDGCFYCKKGNASYTMMFWSKMSLTVPRKTYAILWASVHCPPPCVTCHSHYLAWHKERGRAAIV